LGVTKEEFPELNSVESDFKRFVGCGLLIKIEITQLRTFNINEIDIMMAGLDQGIKIQLTIKAHAFKKGNRIM